MLKIMTLQLKLIEIIIFVIEKYSKLFNLSKELDDVLSFISEAMQNKCPINLNKLKSTGVCLTESMINMIN